MDGRLALVSGAMFAGLLVSGLTATKAIPFTGAGSNGAVTSAPASETLAESPRTTTISTSLQLDRGHDDGSLHDAHEREHEEDD